MFEWIRRGSDDDDEDTYHYCTTVISPECPAMYYDGGYIPTRFRLILEQSDEGEYRTRSVESIMDESVSE